jgi:hypothetical protein
VGERQSDVAGEPALVQLVEHDRADAVQEGIPGQRRSSTRRSGSAAGARARDVLEAHLVADLVAERWPCSLATRRAASRAASAAARSPAPLRRRGRGPAPAPRAAACLAGARGARRPVAARSSRPPRAPEDESRGRGSRAAGCRARATSLSAALSWPSADPAGRHRRRRGQVSAAQGSLGGGGRGRGAPRPAPRA